MGDKIGVVFLRKLCYIMDMGLVTLPISIPTTLPRLPARPSRIIILEKKGRLYL